MDFDEWWKLNGDCKHPDILTQEAWNHQQQRIAALEAAAQRVCDIAEKAHNAGEVYQAILELQAALLPGSDE